MALTFTPVNDLGSPCPEFQLPATDGNIYGSKDLAAGKPFLLMFICNHCPYVVAVEDRLITLGQDLKKMGIPVFAICSNDSEEYPEDGFPEMKKRAEQKKYPFPYLHDETQEVAKKFGALCTPDFFLYDSQRILQYRGRLDDSWKDASKVNKQELLQAAKSLLENTKMNFTPQPSMGCSIKWRT